MSTVTGDQVDFRGFIFLLNRSSCYCSRVAVQEALHSVGPPVSL